MKRLITVSFTCAALLALASCGASSRASGTMSSVPEGRVIVPVDVIQGLSARYKAQQFALGHTLCGTAVSVVSSACTDYALQLSARGKADTAGTTAAYCTSKDHDVMYCCTGTSGAGKVPGDAPCFRDSQDASTLIPD